MFNKPSDKMDENINETVDLSKFCWIIGCAIPVNASSVCKFLFDKVKWFNFY